MIKSKYNIGQRKFKILVDYVPCEFSNDIYKLVKQEFGKDIKRTFIINDMYYVTWKRSWIDINSFINKSAAKKFAFCSICNVI